MVKTFRSSNRAIVDDAGRRIARPGRWRRALLASTAALSLGAQNVAWASCSDGSKMPADGFVVGRDKVVQIAANWSPNVFTAAAGSIFIPDNSVHEHNDPAQPLTGGGHNWVFDQGSTLCKETDVGTNPNALAQGWQIPPNTSTDCVILPVIKNGTVVNLGDIPGQGEAITPTCDPSLLSTATTPNPKNSYFNQLGCSISHGKATTAHTATTWLFVPGIKGGLFSVQLDNAGSAVKGGNAGKTVGVENYYSAIPEGQKLTNAAISPDGRFAVATSNRRQTFIYGCLNPLGNPGDPSKPINPNFFVPSASSVPCMLIGSNALKQDSVTAFGPDSQPYFGGQRIVNTFDSQPGGTSNGAWPQCIWKNNGSLSMADAFAQKRVNGCGSAQPNSGFTAALITQPTALIRHTAANGDKYMYTGPVGGTIVQFKLAIDAVSHMTTYKFRTLLTGISLTTGLGVADDQKSLMVFTDPSAVGLAGQGVVTKLPLCEDMQ